jgi:hypothetical protein
MRFNRREVILHHVSAFIYLLSSFHYHSFLIEQSYHHIVHFHRQRSHDSMAPDRLCIDNDLFLARSFVDDGCSLMTNREPLLVPDVNDGKGDAVQVDVNRGALGVADEEGDVLCMCLARKDSTLGKDKPAKTQHLFPSRLPRWTLMRSKMYRRSESPGAVDIVALTFEWWWL